MSGFVSGITDTNMGCDTAYFGIQNIKGIHRNSLVTKIFSFLSPAHIVYADLNAVEKYTFSWARDHSQGKFTKICPFIGYRKNHSHTEISKQTNNPKYSWLEFGEIYLRLEYQRGFLQRNPAWMRQLELDSQGREWGWRLAATARDTQYCISDMRKKIHVFECAGKAGAFSLFSPQIYHLFCTI